MSENNIEEKQIALTEEKNDPAKTSETQPISNSPKDADEKRTFFGIDESLFEEDEKAGLKFLLLADDTYEVYRAGEVNDRSYYVIPSTFNGKPVTSIGKYAFTEIEMAQLFPNNVCDDLFFNCSQPYYSGDDVKCFSIKDDFKETEHNLEKIVIPESIVNIGEGAFACACKLKCVTLPKSVRQIGTSAFYRTGIVSIEVPEGVEEINCFSSCGSLTKVTLPHSLLLLGPKAFASCIALKHIYYNGTREEFKSISKFYSNEVKSAPLFKKIRFLIRARRYNAFKLQIGLADTWRYDTPKKMRIYYLKNKQKSSS